MTRPSWLRSPVVAVAAVSAAAGFGQFGVTAALGDVAEAFGEATEGLGAEVGMTGTTLGLGLAIIRLSSLAGLPIAAMADRVGRRRVLGTAAAGGLLLTLLAAASPGYWWFVAIFAAGRPLLTATIAVAGVTVAEHTSAKGRAAGVAFVGAAYAVGTGMLTIVRAFGLDFRMLFASTALPLLLLPLILRFVTEPVENQSESAGGLPGAVARRWIPRLAVVSGLHFAVGFLSGPINTYLFLYGERVLGQPPALVTAVFIGSGVSGFVGLLAGRWVADTVGRRIAAGTAMVVAAGAGIVTYWGTVPAMVAGFPLSVMAASAFTPAAGALDAELFPRSVRAAAAGWLTSAQVGGAVAGLLLFGALLEWTQSFQGAAVAIGIPVAFAALLYARLPETRGRELEEIDAQDRPMAEPA
ncbi:MAG TPA: MFS transporter [Egibacteraceae bacterium]|nr:MFS transporter [Egibacteraceae bacterium]